MIRLARPYIPDSAIQSVVRILESGDLVQGEFVAELEKAIEDYLDVSYAIVVSSGTAALHLALMALEIGSDDEVIVPAFTFPATANVVEVVGAKAILVDIGLDDFCIDTSKIESAITSKTRGIVPVHEFGQPADMDSLAELADKYRLKLIEDAACALGADYNGKKVGSFGVFGCFSFHPRKVITTGEGGAVVTNDKRLANRIRAMRNHGLSNTDGKSDLIYAGLNYRMTDFQAAIGVSQMRALEDLNIKRISIGKQYDYGLRDLKNVKIPTRFENRKHVYQTYHIVIDQTLHRETLIHELQNFDIETTLGAQALHCLTYYRKKYGFLDSDFPTALKAYKQGLALPISTYLRQSDVSYICEKIAKAV